MLVTARGGSMSTPASRRTSSAGPLGMRAAAKPAPLGRPRVLLSFSTAVMEGQPAANRSACAAVARTGARGF